MIEADAGGRDDGQENCSYRDTPTTQRVCTGRLGRRLRSLLRLVQVQGWSQRVSILRGRFVLSYRPQDPRGFSPRVCELTFDLHHGVVERLEMLIELLIGD